MACVTRFGTSQKAAKPLIPAARTVGARRGGKPPSIARCRAQATTRTSHRAGTRYPARRCKGADIRFTATNRAPSKPIRVFMNPQVGKGRT